MKHLFTLLFLLPILFSCSGAQKPAESTKSVDTMAIAMRDVYNVLRDKTVGTVKNLDIVIDSTKTSTKDILFAAQAAKGVECTGTSCNVISIWSSQRALELWESKTDKPKWRMKNWTYMCEHNVAEYNVTVGEIDLYPLYDDEYRHWGGQKKRPEPYSLDVK